MVQVKVRPYKLESDYFDSIKGTLYRKMYTVKNGQVNIYFNQDIWYNSQESFANDLHDILFGCLQTPITNENCMSIELKLNYLVDEHISIGSILTKNNMPLWGNLEEHNWIKIHKEPLFNEY